jgi:hypothetical protein
VAGSFCEASNGKMFEKNFSMVLDVGFQLQQHNQGNVILHSPVATVKCSGAHGGSSFRDHGATSFLLIFNV